MTELELKLRLRSFSLRVLKLCDALPRSATGRAIAGQLARSGTAGGANYRSACRARTGPLFVDKLGIAEEEMDEAAYWLELVVGAALLPASRVEPLLREADELTKILCASRMTAKHNLNSPRDVPAERRPVLNRKSKL